MRGAAALLVAIALAACDRTKVAERAETTAVTSSASTAPKMTAPGDAAPEAAASVDPVDASIDVASPPADDPSYVDPAPRAGKSLGHTSVVFRVDLANGKRAVFKPSSRRGPRRYKGEIAAYRLGVALGLTNVPRAYFRVFDAEALAKALAEPAAELYARESIVDGGRVKGAIMPWIDGLQFLPLESEPWRSRWKAWLRRGEAIPDAERGLAADASTLVCFDWMTGNWDRWSGANVGFDEAKHRLLFVDNDGAFYEAPPKDGLARTKRLLDGIDRFSRAFVAHVRALDDARLAAALGDERPGAPLLSKRALAGVTERRAELVRVIDAKIAAIGEAEALAFP